MILRLLNTSWVSLKLNNSCWVIRGFIWRKCDKFLDTICKFLSKGRESRLRWWFCASFFFLLTSHLSHTHRTNSDSALHQSAMNPKPQEVFAGGSQELQPKRGNGRSCYRDTQIPLFINALMQAANLKASERFYVTQLLVWNSSSTVNIYKDTDTNLNLLVQYFLFYMRLIESTDQ